MPGGVLLKGVVKNFAKFTGKQLCRSLFFNEVAGLKPATLLEKDTGTGVSCEFCLIEHLCWLLLLVGNH